MLPRPHRPHDQLLRGIWVAGIGGLIVGHMLWLTGITIAIATRTVSSWVLVVAAVAIAVALGWRSYRRKSEVWAMFLWALPVSPVLLSLVVLGVTYL